MFKKKMIKIVSILGMDDSPIFYSIFELDWNHFWATMVLKIELFLG